MCTERTEDQEWPFHFKCAECNFARWKVESIFIFPFCVHACLSICGYTSVEVHIHGCESRYGGLRLMEAHIHVCESDHTYMYVRVDMKA